LPIHQIPQRNLDAGKGVDERTVAAEQVRRLQYILRDLLDVAAVAADDQRSHDAVERFLRRRNAGMSERLAPAGQPVLGNDLHQQDLEMGPRLAGEVRVRTAHVEGQRDDVRSDRGDLHVSSRHAGARGRVWRRPGLTLCPPGNKLNRAALTFS
jgi:hypothetical protein